MVREDKKRQAAPTPQRAEHLLRTIHNLRLRRFRILAWTSSNLVWWNSYSCLPMARTNANHGAISFHALSVSPWLRQRNCSSFALVERWRTRAFSRWGILRPALRKEGIHKLIASWSSFIAHRTTDNACVCQSCDSRTVLSLRSFLSWTTQLQELHP